MEYFTKKKKITPEDFINETSEILYFSHLDDLLYIFTISIIGFLTFANFKKNILLLLYLIFLSITLEIFHLFIPVRTFQWSDLFGNLLGVIVVILLNNFINKYGRFKK